MFEVVKNYTKKSLRANYWKINDITSKSQMDFWTKLAGWKKKKVNTTIEFCIFELVKKPNFILNWQFWFFGPNLPKKGIYNLKQKKLKPPLNSAYSNQSRYQISALTDNVDQTLTKLAQKGYFPHEKTEHHHLILHIRISPGNQFYFNMTILIFWIKFDQKEYFQLEAAKVSITIEFWIFKLVQVPNFSLNW